MYLFNNYEQGMVTQNLLPLGGKAPLAVHKKRALFETLTGEERPRSIGSLLFVFVLLLHVQAGIWLLRPVEKPTTMAQPLMMQVSLVSAPSQKASIAPPAPPKPAQPPKPEKTPVKKPPKKKTPVKPKQVTPPKTETIAREMPPAPSLPESTAQTSSSASPSVVSSAPAQARTTQSKEAPYTAAAVNVSYGFNPPPKYPAIARRRHWQGKVLLRVSVSPEGYSDAVAVQSSSGHEELDDAAVEAVRKWRFHPAKQGDLAVAGSAIVPIHFTLEH